MTHLASTIIAKQPLAEKPSAKAKALSPVAGCVSTIQPPSWATVKRPILPPNAPTVGYLCGGAGIMSTGFEAAGIRSLWNIDHDPSDPKLSNAIANIYERNFSSPVIRRTLQEVAQTGFAGLERPDILVLTQSCKNLSKSNPKQKETEVDSSVATAATKAIKHFLPQVFVAENVPEYITSQSWEIVGNTLEQLGYNTTTGIINAADYGIAQDRKRFIAIAILNAPAIALPTPTGTKTGWLSAVSDLLKDAETVHPTEKQLTKIQRLCASFLDEPLLIERVAPWGLPNVKSPLAPCWTIRKSIWLDQRHCSRNNAINIRFPDGSWKNLGVRGAARLCSVPDWFQLPNEAWSAGSAIGNGVPCLLGQAIAQSIKPFINQILISGDNAPCTSNLNDAATNFYLQKNTYNTTEDKTMTATTETLVANIEIETVVTNEVTSTNRKVKTPKIRNQHLLENPEIEASAASVITSSFATIKNSLLGMVEEGRKLIDIKISMYSIHGEKSGERKFRKWLNSSDWGGFGRSWAASALALAEWWMTLPKQVQDWLPNNVQGWSQKAITKLPVANAIGKNFMMALVARGKKSSKDCERALNSNKLEIGSYAVVIEKGDWKGEIGKIVDKAEDGVITLEFPTGETQLFAPEKIEAWQDKVPNIAVGDRIVVTGDRDWNNYIGTVVEKRNPTGWWVELDYVKSKNLTTKHFFKTNQLKELVSIFDDPSLLAQESHWEEVNKSYNLSESDKDSVREQALLLASTEAGEGSEPSVTVGHIKSVLDNFGFQPQQQFTSNANPTPVSDNSEEKVYTIAELEALKAEWEQQIRTELLIGLKSELRSQVESEVKSELTAAKTHAEQLTNKYQEALKTLETSKVKIQQVEQLESELQTIKAENERLKQFMADEAANPSRWEKTFTQEAEKVITTDLESKYSPLVEKLEKMTQTVEQQNIELQQYRQSVDENKQLKQSVEVLQEQLNRQQQLTERFKKASVNAPAPQEVEALTLELGEVGEQAGWTGWTARGYRSRNGERFTGLDAIKAFINDMRSAIAPLEDELVLEF
ncbi:C-5 cytosine-specific DNA methylase [Crinalium epipsammum PCC 9333]|uniref:DNA (cytosine-5-)-methyltransferase n=1 Tax=Crinalium epipsammum PCC 9333 TaxID=1173022 RepID=K9VTV4_9CYAN|nr:DNA cytosine methyltransferase [Crinalium epipsammum]AFZ11508.1 C-5 cytosine-specific DNA methylase [Crinalium epipsammum PCC 9333]